MSQSYFVSFSLSHQKFMSFQIPLFGSGNQLILFAIGNEVLGVDFVGFILMLDVIECYIFNMHCLLLIDVIKACLVV